MSRWAALYERMIGHAPTAGQIARIERIRAILRPHESDALWYYLVVNEFYVQLINGNIKRLQKLMESATDSVNTQRAAESTQSGFRALIRHPSSTYVLLAFIALLIGSNLTTGISVAHAISMDADRDTRDRDDRHASENEFQRRIEAKLNAAVGSIQGMTSSKADPLYQGLLGVYQTLPLAVQQRLASDPATTIRTLHVIANLSSEAQVAFDVSNDPGTEQGVARQSALAWFASQVTAGQPGPSKLIAAYAAGNLTWRQFLKSCRKAAASSLLLPANR